jgi:hypothetical protein
MLVWEISSATLRRLRKGRSVDPYRTGIERNASEGAGMWIVLVEWRIWKGREDEFLDYWSTRSRVGNRAGLVAEFLSRAESSEAFPWIRWETDPSWTTYVNVGIWSTASAFQENFGRFIDDSQPPMDFEAERRRRVILESERWRMGAVALPSSDHPKVL